MYDNPEDEEAEDDRNDNAGYGTNMPRNFRRKERTDFRGLDDDFYTHEHGAKRPRMWRNTGGKRGISAQQKVEEAHREDQS